MNAFLLSLVAKEIHDQASPRLTWNAMQNEVNVLALVKGEERFLFLFDDQNRDQTLRQLARFAANPELDFTWYDAAMLSRKIRDACPRDEDLVPDAQAAEGFWSDDWGGADPDFGSNYGMDS